jgi:hypothetical protein
MVTPQSAFHITYLQKLRAARTPQAVWEAVGNDTFLNLTQYVSNFTGIELKGYRHDEDTGALKACAQTLDALEEMVAWMNKSNNLVQIANEHRAGAFAYRAAELVWDYTFANYPNKGPLLNQIRGEFLDWAIGMHENRLGPSKLIEYAPVAL